MLHWPLPAMDLITLWRCDRGHQAICLLHIHTWRQHCHKCRPVALCAHKVDHAAEYTHIDADAHLDDYSLPPGASLKLFSHDLAKRERASEMSIRGGKNEGWRESPWILTGCSLGRTPIISVCLRCQSPTASFRSSRTLTALLFSQGGGSVIIDLIAAFWERNHLTNQLLRVSLISF